MDFRNLQRQNSSVVYSSSFSVLDGIPFKIGPQFKPPNEVLLSSDLNLPCVSKATNLDYDFEVERGVLQWAEERERQIQAQRRAEEEKLANRRTQSSSSDDSDEDPWLNSGQNNTTASKSVTKTQTTTTNSVPQPLIAGLSNTLLTPIQINSAQSSNTQQRADNSVDVSLFEKEEDPFDKFERATLNDLEELKSVFATTETPPPVVCGKDEVTYENTNISVKVKDETEHIQNGVVDTVDGNHDYENVELVHKPLKQMQQVDQPVQIDLSKLPPVPGRKFLTGANPPLPPIGASSSNNPFTSSSYNPFIEDVFDPFNLQNNSEPAPDYENVNVQQNGVVSFAKSDLAAPNIKQKPKVPPRPEFVHIKPKAKPRSDYVNVAPPTPPVDMGNSAMKSYKSSPDVSSNTPNNLMDHDNARYPPPFVLSKTPPERPSSQQSWNRYSPLPPTPSSLNQLSRGSSSSSSGDLTSPSEIDPYTDLSKEAQKSVDGLVDMGFSRPRAARAMQKLGQDKEVIEHLCLVNKLSEEGYDPYQSELALLQFENNSQKAQIYLDLCKQFQELGFTRERIKEALLSNDMDRDKALDYLTT